MSLSSVKLGTSFNKKYTHNLDFDNNTTMDFGSVQPLLCQYLLPKSDVNLNYRQLIRLAPMPTPSFARIFAKNYARFVPMTDIVEYHEAFMSNKPYYSKDRSFIPATMPFTENRVLQYELLWRSQWSVYLPVEGQPSHYQVYNTGSNYESDYNKVMASFYAFIGLGSIPLRPLQQSLFLNNLYAVPLEESDYIVPVYNNAGATDLSQPDGLIVFRFSDEAKRIRKVFVGLGYGLSLDDSNPVSLAPLLAFYKAYYDTFGMTRDKSFESTSCYNLIRHISNYDYDYSMDMYSAAKPTHSPLNIQAVFGDFIGSLAKMFYSTADNFLAAHRLDPMNNASLFAGKSLLEANGNDNADFVLNHADVTMPGVRVGTGSVANKPLIQQLTLDVLKRISRFVSKDSVIGYRISDWVKVHYGADVVSSLFEESNFIHQSSTPVDISDVLLNRADYVKESALIWKLCETDKATGYVSALTFANLVYIMRKQLTPDKIEEVYQKLSLIFRFADLSVSDLAHAAELNWKDFEDAVQSVTAERIHVDYIITRNVRDFAQSKVVAFTPPELLARI